MMEEDEAYESQSGSGGSLTSEEGEDENGGVGDYQGDEGGEETDEDEHTVVENEWGGFVSANDSSSGTADAELAVTPSG